MIAILTRTLYIGTLIALAGCGVRGGLYLPNVPPVPPAPLEPEPQGTLYQPQKPPVPVAAPNTPSSAKP